MESNRIKKYLLTIACIISSVVATCQLAYLHPAGQVAVFGNLSQNQAFKKHEVLSLQIVALESGNLLGTIKQTLKVGNLILGVQTDAVGQVVTVQTNESTVIWSVAEGKVIQTIASQDQVGFSDGVAQVYVGNCCQVTSIPLFSGVASQSYDIGNQSGCKEIISTINDDLLAVHTNRQELLFFHQAKTRPVKKLKADQFFYSTSNNRMVTLVSLGEAGTCYSYQLPSFERVAKLHVSTSIRDYLKTWNDRARKQGSRNYELVGAIQFSKAFSSKDASTLFVPVISGRTYYCYVLDINSAKTLFRFEMDDNDFEREEIANKVLLSTKKMHYQLLHKPTGWMLAEQKKHPGKEFGFENQTNGVQFYGLGENLMQQTVVGCEALLADKENQIALVTHGQQRGKIDLTQSPLKITWFGLDLSLIHI